MPVQGEGLSPERLEALRSERREAIRAGYVTLDAERDIDILLAEVDRLRALLASQRRESA